jgi:hypothetical protein
MDSGLLYQVDINKILSFQKNMAKHKNLRLICITCADVFHYVETNFDDWEESFIRPQISTIILFSVLDQKSSFFLLLFLVNSNIIFYCYVQLQKLVENCSILNVLLKKEKSSCTYYLFCRIVVTLTIQNKGIVGGQCRWCDHKMIFLFQYRRIIDSFAYLALFAASQTSVHLYALYICTRYI